jgi:hypothetical protein
MTQLEGHIPTFDGGQRALGGSRWRSRRSTAFSLRISAPPLLAAMQKIGTGLDQLALEPTANSAGPRGNSVIPVARKVWQPIRVRIPASSARRRIIR